MNTNEYKKGLQTFSSSSSNNLPNNNEELLKELELLPLPENVEVTISDDEQFLNLRLKSEDGSDNKHLLFQLPLKENDLSALKSTGDYSDLEDRYHTYMNEYKDKIKEYAMQERTALKEKFPGLVFTIKIRIKSRESYLNKINKNILEGKSPYINDIMAERIIINEYKGSQDEETLTQMCYEVAKALYDFRINTNFRMQEDGENNVARTDEDYITKDYIAHPKENGYQSLHILMRNKRNKDFFYETQIRTYEMENASKNDEKVSHKNYKPRPLNDISTTRVPSYCIITPFDDEKGKPIIFDPTIDDRFYHFYNNTIGLKNSTYKKGPTITYDLYQEEMATLTEVLGKSLKDIRTKLRSIHISKYIKSCKNEPETDSNISVK